MRVSELAKELGLTSKEVIEKFAQVSIVVKTHSSSVTPDQIKKLKDFIAGGSKQEVKKPKAFIVKKAKPEEKPEEVCNVNAWSDTVDKTVTHIRKGGDTWGGIVKAYYPCLVQEKGLSGAIRALKVALLK